MHWLDPTGSRDELGLRTQGHERGHCESVVMIVEVQLFGITAS